MDNFFVHIQDGISQAERQLEALMPDYVKVDDRSRQELIRYLSHLSTQFNYYNFDNIKEGDWREFFSSDLVVLLISASALDFTAYEEQYLRIREGMQNAEFSEILFNAVKAFFELLYDIGILLMHLLRQLQQADRTYHIWSYLQAVMVSLEDDMGRLLMYEQSVQPLFPREAANHIEGFRTPAVIQALSQLFPHASRRGETGTLDFEGYASLEEIYHNYRAIFYQISRSAHDYLKTPREQPVHHPHIGLLFAFTDLYAYLQEHINEIPKRHLDLYYHNILGIKYRAPTPDRVNVFFEPAPNTRTVALPAGEELAALINPDKPPLYFATLEPLKVQPTRIMKLYTLFESDYLQITAPSLKYQDIRESQHFAGTPPITPPVAFTDVHTPVGSWPLLGEDQHDLSPAQRTMSDTDIGFIVGSPVLFLTEGHRTIQLKLYFDAATYQQLAAYITNIAAVVGRKESVVTADLFANAFRLSFTGAAGWENVQRYSAKCFVEENNTSYLEITFILDATVGAFITYNQALHGGNYNAVNPLLRILLNNASFHHPYSFLRHLLLERVIVTAKVKGFRTLKLFGMTGELNAASPFHIFGTQPAVGAFIDIRNTNVFNKYTKYFRININWLNLPREENGFDAYYAAYNAGMTNDAFKVGISSLYEGTYLPEPEDQQLFRLFETARDKEGNIYLTDNTRIEGVDFRKVSFPEGMSLSAESEKTKNFYYNGVLRLELAAPSEGFGHRLFTQIFPAAVMHNAKKKNKLPLPNTPYAPVAKSISINYTLEHGEVLTSMKALKSEVETELFHICPFGFRQIYPKTGRNTFPLLPEFDNQANLYIGFNELIPDEELSLLFQLNEEHCHIASSANPIPEWSYLDEQGWQPVRKDYVLSDSTNQLSGSGIIKIKVPAGIRKGNPIMDPELYWLRVAHKKAGTLHTRALAVFPNAVAAERIIDAEGSSLEAHRKIPGNVIKKLKSDMKTIQRVWQLFPSFGGRKKESDREFYTRVSERLRHKQRPVTNIDIAQTLLQAFPSILIVKCLSATDNEKHRFDTDADVRMVVVPRQSDDGRFISAEPQVPVTTLTQIRTFMSQTLYPFMKVEIRNPVYEKVKIVCHVRFENTPGYNNSYYLNKLKEDIRQYLCPWLYDDASNLKIGSILYKSELLNYIHKLPYITYVTAFSIVHFYTSPHGHNGKTIAHATDSAQSDTQIIRPSVPEGVLIPADQHLITVMDENYHYEEPTVLGIGKLQISDELLIGKGNETAPETINAIQETRMEEEMLTISISSSSTGT